MKDLIAAVVSAMTDRIGLESIEMDYQVGSQFIARLDNKELRKVNKIPSRLRKVVKIYGFPMDGCQASQEGPSSQNPY